jgi:hypothetical protein
VHHALRLVFGTLLIAALVAGVLQQNDTRAYTVQTVEISELGFNPSICRMNREYVRFKNVSDSVMRVGRPSVFAGEPPFDVQEIQPGGFSIEYLIAYGGSTVFMDVDNPEHKMTVITPVFVQTWEPICTPTVPVTPPPSSSNCSTQTHCLRLPLLATD